MSKEEIIGIKRHCLGSDGNGVTTLVAFHGCLLRCRYCLNPQCHSSFDPNREMSPEQLMEILKKDELYFIATKGGVTFGGGEPLIKSEFILNVLSLGAQKWNTTLETSLCAEKKHLEKLMPWIDEYIVDVKDMNSRIYQSYTGRRNSLMKSNLHYLIETGRANQILCRLPLIPGYNTEADRQRSEDELIEMGITRFEKFSYIKRDTKLDAIANTQINGGQGLTGLPFIMGDRKKTTMTLEDVKHYKKKKEEEKKVWEKFKKEFEKYRLRGIIVDEDE